MERETTEKTIGAHTLKVKTYTSAREVNAIQQAYRNAVTTKITDGKPEIEELNIFEVYSVQLEMVKQLVVAIDGDAEKIDERVQDIPNDDFLELSTYLDSIISKKNTK